MIKGNGRKFKNFIAGDDVEVEVKTIFDVLDYDIMRHTR